MAWNGSTNTSQPARQTANPKKGAHLAVIIGCILFACLGVLVYWFARPTEEKPVVVDEEPLSRSLETNNPAKARAVPEKKKKYAEMTRDEKLAYYRNKYGNNLPENLKPIVYYLEHPPQKTFTPPSRPEGIFKRHSERTIAAFLKVEPGAWMMRPMELGDRFDSDLAKALCEEIEFTDDDTEEQRELKQAVIDTKKELAERIKKGEKASAIMTETAKQLYELGQYKKTLEDQIRDIRRDASMSDKDVEDAVNAANMMLKEKGLPPMKMPNMLFRRASLKQAAKMVTEKSKKEK